MITATRNTVPVLSKEQAAASRGVRRKVFQMIKNKTVRSSVAYQIDRLLDGRSLPVVLVNGEGKELIVDYRRVRGIFYRLPQRHYKVQMGLFPSSVRIEWHPRTERGTTGHVVLHGFSPNPQHDLPSLLYYGAPHITI